MPPPSRIAGARHDIELLPLCLAVGVLDIHVAPLDERINFMDVLDDARALVEAQLRTLDEEERRLRRALDHLHDPDGRTSSRIQARSSSAPHAKRRGRPAKRTPKGERRDQFMHCIADSGRQGITVAEIAEKIGLSSPNSLHPVAKHLLRMGAVSKEGPRYYPVGVKPSGSA
jgi:AraC-like DNA-binding protein